MREKIQRVKLEPLKSWIENEVVFTLDAKQCEYFNDFVSKHYPWQGYIKDRIAWEELEQYKQLDWSNADVAETKAFIEATCLSKYKLLAVIYSAFEPGVVGSFDFIVDHLEALNNLGAAGAFFVVGASKNNYGVVELNYEDFFELWSLKLLITAPA